LRSPPRRPVQRPGRRPVALRTSIGYKVRGSIPQGFPLMPEPRAAVILAAGKGVRMRSQRPKVLHEVGGRSMLSWSIALARGVGATTVIVVVGKEVAALEEAARAEGCATVVQDPPLGTGHAVRAAAAALKDVGGQTVVLFADTPLVRAETVEQTFAALDAGAAVAVVGFEPEDPGGYGRLMRDAKGGLERIVEAADAGPAELAGKLCNSGVIAARTADLLAFLAEVTDANARKEYYLTDLVAIARAKGKTAAVVRADADEVLGVNSRADLARAEAAFQARARAAAMEAGATLRAPDTVFFEHDTKLGPDVTVEPHVVFGAAVTVEEGAIIRSFTHITQSIIRAGAEVGPFARLRPGADVGERAKVGNFVELKNTTLGAGAKASHLSYLGDAVIGAKANIGAGTITCNYDGYAKHQTVIGEGAFIGSDTSLVAPVTVGARAYTGAGSVITKDIPDDALAVARGEQREIAGWSIRFRAKHKGSGHGG
jgi:bifunctional UDP-N-acetylglucosamine pyrophosphorylase/glucosamine-1-phosphate N-acetyltransferase